MAHKNDGACANRQQIRTMSTAASPDPNSTRARGAPANFPTRPAAASFSSSRGLRQADNAASKLCRMGYRFQVENVKRGSVFVVRDSKTIEVLELRVGYDKDRFGKL